MDEILATSVPVFAAVGALVVISVCLQVISSIYKTFLRPAKNLKKLGKWAVITGATDGIGKAYALALAKKGMSIFLISRTEQKLQDVCNEIDEKKYAGVETKYLVCDYNNFNPEARAKVGEAISSLDVGVLINNVGVSYPYPKFFHELSDEQVASLIEMNVNSTTWMTKMVIGGMDERRHGAIVNIASAAGCYTMPLLAQYSAAKSYIAMFSRGLNAEYSGKGVTVQCQVPFYVATKLAKLRKSFTVPTPESYVKLGIRWIGYKDAVVSPFWFHAVQGWVMCRLPSALVDKLVMAMHMAIRKAGMKKEAMKKAKDS